MADTYGARVITVTGAHTNAPEAREIEMLVIDRPDANPTFDFEGAEQRFRAACFADAKAIYEFLASTVPGGTFDAIAQRFLDRAKEMEEITDLLN